MILNLQKRLALAIFIEIFGNMYQALTLIGVAIRYWARRTRAEAYQFQL